ncbi:hypothetical protein OUZ56_016737 [Daphnia magna]|uniref:Uncharacterized protein n=1 Tax=Daphnia magna TaxID=35525 RepID=A0ABR0ARE4_9CRUS|nr:hypothetical protein OUZ56_016737 [Daphnia magna]
MKEELLDQEEQRLPLACPNNTQKGKPSNANAGESVHRDYSFTLSGNDAENCKAAAKDLLDGLPVRLECPDLALDGVKNLKIK